MTSGMVLDLQAVPRPGRARRLDSVYGEFISSLGYPTTSNSSCCVYTRSDALSWWKSSFCRTQQRYERRSYGSIVSWIRESGEYMMRYTNCASFVGATAGDAQRQARHFKWGLKKWVLDRIETGDRSNRRTSVVMTRISMSIRGRQDQSVEHRGRQDRGYDSKRQDFRGQDQRFTGRNGNDRQGQGQRRSTETLPPPPLCTTCGKPHPGVCYKATGGCFTCGSTQHKVKDCPPREAKQKPYAIETMNMLTAALLRHVSLEFPQGAKFSGFCYGQHLGSPILIIVLLFVNSLMCYPDEIPGLPPLERLNLSNELIPELETLSVMGKLYEIFTIIRVSNIFLPAELNMNRRRWLELFNDMTQHPVYHPGKANVSVRNVELCVQSSGGYWASMRIESNSLLQIKEAQRDDGEYLWAIALYARRLYDDAHSSSFTNSPSSPRLYRDLKQYFWVERHEEDVATFKSLDCMDCPTSNNSDKEIHVTVSFFGKDYRKLGELVLSLVQHFILKPMVSKRTIQT
ncbi:zinc finger, CCHC-type, retrotransposon gag domain protein [Tanacetum coccineum]